MILEVSPGCQFASAAKKVYQSLYSQYKLGVKFDLTKIFIKFQGKLNSMAGWQNHLPEKRCQ